MVGWLVGGKRLSIQHWITCEKREDDESGTRRTHEYSYQQNHCLLIGEVVEHRQMLAAKRMRRQRDTFGGG